MMTADRRLDGLPDAALTAGRQGLGATARAKGPSCSAGNRREGIDGFGRQFSSFRTCQEIESALEEISSPLGHRGPNAVSILRPWPRSVDGVRIGLQSLVQGREIARVGSLKLPSDSGELRQRNAARRIALL